MIYVRISSVTISDFHLHYCRIYVNYILAISLEKKKSYVSLLLSLYYTIITIIGEWAIRVGRISEKVT